MYFLDSRYIRSAAGVWIEEGGRKKEDKMLSVDVIEFVVLIGT